MLASSADDKLFSSIYNWQWPAINRHSLAAISRNLSNRIRENIYDTFEISVDETDSIIEGLNFLHDNTVALIFNGNGLTAIPAFISTLETIKSIFEPLNGWQTAMDNKAMPMQLARRLISIQTGLDEITPNKKDLEARINLINEATETAENLPANLSSLKDARNKVEKFTTDSAELYGKIDTYNAQASAAILSMREKKAEADEIVQKASESYRITTSIGLAAAFDERANSSSNAMWAWVVGLITALSIGAVIGSNRIALLSDALKASDPHWGVITMQVILSLLSIGAPLWFAWLSTKQVNQRFRLSEDYAFKASVAKAYEGYRREAVRIDPLFEARLFNSALERLEEAPLRLVEDDVHGSPWHELFASKPFQKALQNIPEFKDSIIQMMKDKLPNLNKTTIEDVKATIDEQATPLNGQQ